MNFRDGQSIYLQIAERLCDEILAGRYGSDERVPGVREYAALLQVNINTAHKAFDNLVQRGILYNKRGLGSFVAVDAHERITKARRQEFLTQQLPDVARTMLQLGLTLTEVMNALRQMLDHAPPITPQASAEK